MIHPLQNKIELKLKLRSRREKDMWDIARLEELRNFKNDVVTMPLNAVAKIKNHV